MKSFIISLKICLSLCQQSGTWKIYQKRGGYKNKGQILLGDNSSRASYISVHLVSKALTSLYSRFSKDDCVENSHGT